MLNQLCLIISIAYGEQVLTAVAHQPEFLGRRARVSNFSCEAVWRSQIAVVTCTMSTRKLSFFGPNAFINTLDYGAPLVVPREKLVDETDCILPTSFLPLDQKPGLFLA